MLRDVLTSQPDELLCPFLVFDKQSLFHANHHISLETGRKHMQSRPDPLYKHKPLIV